MKQQGSSDPSGVPIVEERLLGIRLHRSPAVLLAVGVTLFAAAGTGHATPSTTFWAPSTPYVQAFGVLHTTYDTYFRNDAAYPIDVGLEIGALPSKRLQLELGFDLLYPTFSAGEPMNAPLLLNAKLGAPEGAYFSGSPGWSAGIFAVGFEEDVTDYNVVHAMVALSAWRRALSRVNSPAVYCCLYCWRAPGRTTASRPALCPRWRP